MQRFSCWLGRSHLTWCLQKYCSILTLYNNNNIIIIYHLYFSSHKKKYVTSRRKGRSILLETVFRRFPSLTPELVKDKRHQDKYPDPIIKSFHIPLPYGLILSTTYLVILSFRYSWVLRRFYLKSVHIRYLRFLSLSLAGSCSPNIMASTFGLFKKSLDSTEIKSLPFLKSVMDAFAFTVEDNILFQRRFCS